MHFLNNTSLYSLKKNFKISFKDLRYPRAIEDKYIIRFIHVHSANYFGAWTVQGFALDTRRGRAETPRQQGSSISSSGTVREALQYDEWEH